MAKNIPVTPARLLSDDLYLRPAIPLTIALIIGIIAGDRLPGFALLVGFLLVACLVGLILDLKNNSASRWSLLAALTAAGYLAITPWVAPAFGPDHIVNYLDGDYWRISGSVVDTPTTRFGRTRLVLESNTLFRDGITRPVRGRIRLTIMGDIDLAQGDRLTFSSRLRPLRNFNNPGGFDYRRFMRFKNIHASAWVKAEALRNDGNGGRLFAARILGSLREHLGRTIDMAGGENAAEEKALLKALVYGDRTGIDDALRERFNRSGVGHLLAISGLHVGIVAAVAYRCLAWIFSFMPPLLWRAWSRKWAAAVTVLIVLAYGLLAGMSPSTQRAVTMVIVVLTALILGRSHDILNTVAVAAMVILVIFPPALFSISFQLSFAAVLAVVVGLEKLGFAAGGSMGTVRAAGRRLAGFVLVSALAVAGTAPLVLYYFNQTSLVSIAANLLLVPLVGFVTVPLGLAATVATVFSASLGSAGFGLCIAILSAAITAVNWFAGLSFAAVKTVTPSVPEIVLYYLVGWALLNLRKSRPVPWLLATVLVLAGGDALYWSYQRFWHKDLRVTAIDVGQGASTLMELPGGKVLLFDGGGFADNRLFDMGRRVIAPLLWGRKIATVDIMVLSHPNADHLNGLIYVARHFKVRELWTNGDVNDTWGYRELMDVCRRRSITVRSLVRSNEKRTVGAVAFEILHPPPHESGDTIERGRNDLSLVLKATYGRTAFLLTGDITDHAEAMLVRLAGNKLVSTVLFAPHHGSKTSSSAGLIAAVSPDSVVISDGAGNRFGFPHPEVIARYRAAGSRIYRTGVHGAIALRSDGNSVQIGTFAGNADATATRP